MKKYSICLFLVVAFLLSNSYMLKAEEDGWWDVTSEKDVKIEETAETTTTETSVEETTNTEEQEEEKKEEAVVEEDRYEYYTIVSGDTLSAIALRFLGNASRYKEIQAENPEIIIDCNKIYAGDVIRIKLDNATASTKTEEKVEEDDPAPVVETKDESTDSNEVTETTIEYTNMEKLQKLQAALDAANAKLPEGYGIVAFTSDTVKFLTDNGFITMDELVACQPPEGYTWCVNNGKIELRDSKNNAVTEEEIEAMDKANAEKKNAEEESTETEVTTETSTDTNTNTNTNTNTEEKKGFFEGIGSKLDKGIATIGNWVKEAVEYERATRKARVQNLADTAKTTLDLVTLPGRTVLSGLWGATKGFFVGGEGNGLIPSAVKTVTDTFNEVTGLKDRCDGRMDDAVTAYKESKNNNNGGTTTHTSSSGATHGGSGGHF